MNHNLDFLWVIIYITTSWVFWFLVVLPIISGIFGG